MSIIWFLNLALGKVFDIVLAPFAKINPLWGLGVVSFITGAVMVFIFKYVSNQEGIRRSKAKVRGYFLEVWIYKHDFKVVTGSIGRILLANLKYMRFAVAPLIVLMIPVILIMVHLNLRYNDRPLNPGETAILTAEFNQMDILEDLELTAISEGGFAVETPPVRAIAAGEVSWRLRAESPGKRFVTIFWSGGEVKKEIVVGSDKVSKTSFRRSAANSLSDALFLPGEKPLPSGSPVISVSVKYPPRQLRVLGIGVHWIVVFFVLSIVAGFALKGVFGVEI